jgi:23S rRNA (uracil1939-C5)-methyltransferase
MTSGKIEKLAFGAEGILREDSGRVVFIPYTLPNELVSYQIIEEKKDFARAKILNIIQSHPERCHAPCPHYEVCSGCQLQHASFHLQLEIKRLWLEEQLKRVAKIDYQVLPLQSFKPWGYRRSVEWSVEKGIIGYRSSLSKHIPIQRCLLIPDDQRALMICSSLIQTFNIHTARIRWIQQKNQLPTAVIDCLSSINPKILDAAWSRLEKDLRGIVICKGKKMTDYRGQYLIKDEVLGLTIHWNCTDFLQNNFEASLAFYDWIQLHLQGCGKLLDLYCGVGITSLLAARKGWQVKGLEWSQTAIRLAKKNAQDNALISQCHFSVQDLEKITPTNFGQYESIIVNPPRQGISALLLQKIIDSPVKQVIYLSCNPATLARDIRALTENRFSISALQAFDCFSQTYHFETAVLLKR